MSVKNELEESESIELLTLAGHHDFRGRLGSQPRHSPLFLVIRRWFFYSVAEYCAARISRIFHSGTLWLCRIGTSLGRAAPASQCLYCVPRSHFILLYRPWYTGVEKRFRCEHDH